MANWLQKQWLTFTPWHLLLLPVSYLFSAIVTLRKYLYKAGWLRSCRLSVPVIVVGNINVGGAGKTPLVIWLAEQLAALGYKPGIISRGYGSSLVGIAAVSSKSDPRQVGDEPVLIAMRTSCPVFVGAKRADVGRALLAAHPECNIIISDDGLQHYALHRDIEIVVFDGVKGFGNQALLPAGPLRESVDRLKAVDIIVSNGTPVDASLAVVQQPVEMQLKASAFYKLNNRQLVSDSATFVGKSITAIAGIGNPDRFFRQLTAMGLHFDSKVYNDHYQYRSQDFEHIRTDILLMTEKDAVKCLSFARDNFWVLPVNAELDRQMLTYILNKLDQIKH